MDMLCIKKNMKYTNYRIINQLPAIVKMIFDVIMSTFSTVSRGFPESGRTTSGASALLISIRLLRSSPQIFSQALQMSQLSLTIDTGTEGNCLMMCSKASFSWSFPQAVIVLQYKDTVSETRHHQDRKAKLFKLLLLLHCYFNIITTTTITYS